MAPPLTDQSTFHTHTHTHTPAVSRVCAGQNLKSSMDTEADRPIIRCTLRSASPPLKGSRCENTVVFTRASSMTRPNNKRRRLHKESGWTDVWTLSCHAVSSGGFSHFELQEMWCSAGMFVKSWTASDSIGNCIPYYWCFVCTDCGMKCLVSVETSLSIL